MFRHVIRAALVAGVTSTMLAAAPAVAGAQWSPSLTVKLGATLPVGDFGDAVATGYHVGIGAEFAQRLSPIGVRLELDYHENELDEDVFGETDLDWRHVAGIANVTFQRPGSSLYLIGGLGLYRGYISDIDDSGDTNAGINAGAGLRFNLTGFSTFVEARFHHLFNDNETVDASTQFIPISFGVRF
ncbi:MAG TPA: outer membrane beta-barrel protein [Gemmatimonadaceae bacterium]|nr:outer membrane beta-barrel protein [Gemmatimonadaceae bacterium]